MESCSTISDNKPTFLSECTLAQELIDKADISIENHDSCMQPFMMNSINKDKHNIRCKNVVNNNHITNVLQLLSQIPLPYTLRILYTAIGKVNVELYYNNWTLLSLNKVKTMYNHYISNNQTRSVDFAFMYCGMGHACMVSFDPITNKIYYKMQNGANGYEADDNYRNAISYVPIEKDLHNISHWFTIIENKTLEMCDIPFYTVINP